MVFNFYKTLSVENADQVQWARREVAKLYCDVVSKLWVDSHPSGSNNKMRVSLSKSLSFNEPYTKCLTTRLSLNNSLLIERLYWKQDRKVARGLLAASARETQKNRLRSRLGLITTDIDLVCQLFDKNRKPKPMPSSVLRKRLTLAKQRQSYDPWIFSLGANECDSLQDSTIFSNAHLG